MVVAVFSGVARDLFGYDFSSLSEDREQIVLRLFTDATSSIGGGWTTHIPFSFFVVPRSDKPIVIEVKPQSKDIGKWHQLARLE